VSFYGTANHSFVPLFDPGIVFRLTPTGVLTMLYTFCSETNCIDGWDLFSGVVQGSDGNFYGTSWNGGDYNEGTVLLTSRPGPSEERNFSTFVAGRSGALGRWREKQAGCCSARGRPVMPKPSRKQ
jgi:hypothetical protein